MLQNYFKTAWRNLNRRKLFALINTFGLALGISVFILIFQYVRFETSYDTFQEEGEHIYRVQVDRYHNGRLEYQNAYTVPAIGQTVKDQIPGVKDYFRLTSWAESHTIIYDENGEKDPVIFKEEKTIFADPSFVSWFSLDIVKSSSHTLLTEPGRVIISESTAERYFGRNWITENPVGKTLLVYNSNRDDETTFTIDAVFKDIPSNSHLEYDIIFSHSSLTSFLPNEIPEEQRLSMFETAWGPYAWYTYLVLDEQTDPQKIEEKITSLVEKRNQTEQTREIFSLQLIQSIHLHSNLMNEPSENGNAVWIYVIMVAGVCVLCLAWVNYINISTAIAVDRAKEVGLRKIAGASRSQLIARFLFETAVVNVVAFFFAAAVVQMAAPYFNDFAGIPSEVFLLNNPEMWIFFGGIYVVGTLFTGFYPAIVLTAFKPTAAVKGQSMLGAWGIGLRKGRVVFQFAASVVLISSTAIVYQQIEYMQEENPGIQTSRVLILDGVNVIDQQTSFLQTVENLRNGTIHHPSIRRVSAVSNVPGETEGLSRMVSRMGMKDEIGIKEIKEIGADSEYFSLMGIDFLAGRGFSSVTSQNQNKLVINESALDLLDFHSPEEAVASKVGIENYWGTTEYEIIGVIRNFHQRSLQYSIEPLLFSNEMFDGNYVIQLSSSSNASVGDAIQFLGDQWDHILPNNPFNYFFLDSHYVQQYKADQRFGELMGLFSIVAIFIACLGLFGLAAFSAEKRMKEIGIRKVLGASVAGIVNMMGRQFLKLVLLGIAIAVPIAWVTMSFWLQDFASRIEIEPATFLWVGLATILIALATVSWQSIKAALMNPVNSLRSE